MARRARDSGSKEFGPYILHEELGRGGMAIVYRAESRKSDSVGRVIALKRLLPHDAFDADFDLVRSFVEEARLATRFHHLNIAQTYSLGKIDGSYYIAMEYVPGPTLLQLLQQAEIAGALPLPVVVQILIQICDALGHVHGVCDDTGKPLGIVHRDVSLSNIIVSRTGIVKLIDFGIAKNLSSQARTQAGTIKGKFGYVAPEYLAGRLDTRADLFAVGVIAHELLTGRRLFQGKNELDTITRLRGMRIQPPSRSRPEVSRELDDLVMRALEREPDQRWQTAAAIRGGLIEVLRTLGPADPHRIRAWVEWAFSVEPKDDSQLSRVIDSLDQPTVAVDLSAQLVSVEPVDDVERPVTEVAPPVAAAVEPQPKPPPPAIDLRRRVPLWLVTVAMMVACAVVAILLG